MLVEIIGKRNEERIITTSRNIAVGFNKRHSDVLRDIENWGVPKNLLNAILR